MNKVKRKENERKKKVKDERNSKAQWKRKKKENKEKHSERKDEYVFMSVSLFHIGMLYVGICLRVYKCIWLFHTTAERDKQNKSQMIYSFSKI